MIPRVSVFLPSYNKHAYCVEAVQSILDQDDPRWELWIMENSTDSRTRSVLRDHLPALESDPRIIYEEMTIPDDVRRTWYVTPWLLNKYYAHARGDIIAYLSDDDLFTPGCFGTFTRYFDAHPECDVAYCGLRVSRAAVPGEGRTAPWANEIPALLTRGKGGDTRFVDCQIDGGQMMHRTTTLAAISQPWFHEARDGDASHCDGLFLDKLAREFLFHPLDFHGVTHRLTPLSTWSRL